MAGKTFKREVYVQGTVEAGPGKVRVTFREGDPPEEPKEGAADGAAPAARARMSPDGGELPTVVMRADEAPATFDKMIIKVEKR